MVVRHYGRVVKIGNDTRRWMSGVLVVLGHFGGALYPWSGQLPSQWGVASEILSGLTSFLLGPQS
jgi:hypothetical protein